VVQEVPFLCFSLPHFSVNHCIAYLSGLPHFLDKSPEVQVLPLQHHTQCYKYKSYLYNTILNVTSTSLTFTTPYSMLQAQVLPLQHHTQCYKYKSYLYNTILNVTGTSLTFTAPYSMLQVQVLPLQHHTQCYKYKYNTILNVTSFLLRYA
jgi:hypothetical protein